MTLTKAQARAFLLAHQGLSVPRAESVAACVRRLGCVQFDPLDICGHNHDIVLQARIPGYRPAELRAALYAERTLLDGWDKNQCIHAIEDWPYLTRHRARWQARMDTLPPVREAAADLLEQIRARGPLCTRDIAKHGQEVLWGDTSVARAALEALYQTGALIIHHRERTQRYFDLAERWIPETLRQTPALPDDEYADWMVLRRVGAVGLLWNRGSDAWLGSGLQRPQRDAAFRHLEATGRLLPVDVEGDTLYLRAQDRATLESALASPAPAESARFLAPLDALLWDRKLLHTLFGFAYRWEVYKPAEQRQYGHYVLPVLYGARFIARAQPLRTPDALHIANWWWEPDVMLDRPLWQALRALFARFAQFLDRERWTLGEAAAEALPALV